MPNDFKINWECDPISWSNWAKAIHCSPAELGVGMRVTVQLREHKRPRINKKWRKRYGVVSFTIPPGSATEMIRTFYHVRRQALLMRVGKLPTTPLVDL